MQPIRLAATALAALALTSAAASAGTWCSYYYQGGTNCGFYSYAQCMANVTGIGGYCSPNPAAASESRPRR